MYYIVGLGNPGQQYEQTRHNIGWAVLDAWLAVTGLPSVHQSAAVSGRVSEGNVHGTDVAVLYPETFMNNSGSAVAKLVAGADVANVVVVYDDVDIPFGQLKISVGGSSGGHNGIKSITKALNTEQYIRLRVGIAPISFWTGAPKRPAGAKLPAFVLKPFSTKEQRELPEVLAQAIEALDTIVRDGVSVAMNRYN